MMLAAVALALWPDRPPRTPRPISEGAHRRGHQDPRTRRALLVGAALFGVSLLFLPNSLEAALPTVLVIAWFSTKLPIRPTAQERVAQRQQLAAVCDLLATCLTAGMATGAALTAVLDQFVPVMSSPGAAHSEPIVPSPSPSPSWSPQPSSQRWSTGSTGSTGSSATSALRAVAALLALGADAGKAWAPADSVPDLIPIAAAARRSTMGGVGLAQAVREQADALGLEVAQDLERKAGRAGVLMAAPLGLCFLPAFICLGLAPVIIALLADLGIG